MTSQQELDILMLKRRVGIKLKAFINNCSLQELNELFNKFQVQYPEIFEIFVDFFWSNVIR